MAVTKTPTEQKSDTITQEMMEVGLHFGHRTSKTHPKMKPFIAGVRNAVHIIDLEKTKEKLIKKTNINTKHLEVVYLSSDDLNKLNGEFGTTKTTELIQSLNDYLLSIGKPQKYKSHLHTLRGWGRKDSKAKNKNALETWANG